MKRKYKQALKITELKEREFYHRYYDGKTDKNFIYFIENNKLYSISINNRNRCLTALSYNNVIDSVFIEADIFIDPNRIQKWTEVEAWIDGGWVPRYLYEYKESKIETEISLGNGISDFMKTRDIIIIVSPISKEMFDNSREHRNTLQFVDKIRFDIKKDLNNISWRI